MNERPSTTAGLEPDDGGAAPDSRERLRDALQRLDAAEACLAHRVTHETAEACQHIRSARRQIESTTGEG